MKIIDEQFYFTVKDVGEFFGKSPQWVHYGEKRGWWVHPMTGNTIEPMRFGSGQTRLYSVEDVRAMGEVLLGRGLFEDEDDFSNFVDKIERFQ